MDLKHFLFFLFFFYKHFFPSLANVYNIIINTLYHQVLRKKDDKHYELFLCTNPSIFGTFHYNITTQTAEIPTLCRKTNGIGLHQKPWKKLTIQRVGKGDPHKNGRDGGREGGHFMSLSSLYLLLSQASTIQQSIGIQNLYCVWFCKNSAGIDGGQYFFATCLYWVKIIKISAIQT